MVARRREDLLGPGMVDARGARPAAGVGKAAAARGEARSRPPFADSGSTATTRRRRFTGFPPHTTSRQRSSWTRAPTCTQRARLIREKGSPTHPLTSYYRTERVAGTHLTNKSAGPGGGFRVWTEIHKSVARTGGQAMSRQLSVNVLCTQPTISGRRSPGTVTDCRTVGPAAVGPASGGSRSWFLVGVPKCGSPMTVHGVQTAHDLQRSRPEPRRSPVAVSCDRVFWVWLSCDWARAVHPDML